MLSRLFIQSGLTRKTPVFLGLSLAVILSGCGKAKEPWETTYPVKGVVKYGGKSLAGADVAFFPQGKSIPDSVRPRATTGEDGSFVLWTYEKGDGAPAGNYKVTVVHHVVGQVNGVTVTHPNDLPAKYSTLQNTDLRAEVGPKETELPPIELK